MDRVALKLAPSILAADKSRFPRDTPKIALL